MKRLLSSLRVFFLVMCLLGLTQSINVASSVSNGESIVCGKEKNGEFVCYTNEKSVKNKKGKKYTGNSLKEIVQKENLYGKPIIYRDLTSKKTNIVVLESTTSKDFMYFDVDLNQTNWQSSFENYSWWDSSSYETTESADFYEEALEEYSDEYEDENNDDSDFDSSDSDSDSDDDDGDDD